MKYVDYKRPMIVLCGAASSITVPYDGRLIGIARPTNTAWSSVRVNGSSVVMTNNTSADELHYINIPLKKGDIVSWDRELRGIDVNGNCIKAYPFTDQIYEEDDDMPTLNYTTPLHTFSANNLNHIQLQKNVI